MSTVSFTADFIAGWVAGGAGLILGHPLDTIKVRLQALSGYKGAYECVLETLRQEAVGGFYKGMMFPFLSTGLLHSLYFGGHGITIKMLKTPTRDELDVIPLEHLILGSVMGAAFQWVPACPIEIVKIKLQIQKESVPHTFLHWADHISYKKSAPTGVIFSSPWDCLRQTVHYEGVAGLYRGGLVMLIRDVLGFCCYLPVHERIKYYLTLPWRSKTCTMEDGRTWDGTEGHLSHHQRLAISLLAGGIAGVASWLPILPLDMVKSRLQADPIVNPVYTGAWHCARESFRREGLSIFFRGWQIVAVRAIPINAVLLLCYDETLRFLSQHHLFVRE